MAYQSLYRKYRSRDFGDLMGQRHVTQTLANAIGSDRVAHAYLFCGPRGTGKTSTARVLAKALNCVNGPTDTPCDTCAYCNAIRQGSAMDVIEIDAASNRNIDDMRQLREQVNYPPVELRYKFYIVDEVHQLTRDAFNAFLKTLEEPPPHVIFVLCTTDPHQLPPTILSRCQRFDFHRITIADIVERLRWIVEQEGWTIEEEALTLLARAANGGLRDALSLLDQAASFAGTDIAAHHVRDILGGIDFDLLVQYTDLLLKRDANGLFRLVDEVISAGKDVPQLVAETIQHWRNLLRAAIGGAEALIELTPEQRGILAQQARSSGQTAIMRALTLLCEAENELRWNSQQRLLLELYSLRIMNDDPPPVVSASPAVNAQPAQRTAPRGVEAPAPPRSEPRPEPRPASPPPVSSAPTAPASTAPSPAVAADDNPWTLPRVKKIWPQFIEWMGRSPKLEALRSRIVEKCWPTSLIGNTLSLATSSAFVRDQMKDRPQVRQTLEQCLQAYFKTAFVIQIDMQGEAAPPPPPAPEPTPVPTPIPVPIPAQPATVSEPSTPPETPVSDEVTAPPEPAHDHIGNRMHQVFADSVEITPA